MKELFNTLSNISNFFLDKRFLNKGGELSQRPFGEGSKLSEVFPSTSPEAKKLINTPAFRIRKAQKRGREMRKRAEEKFGQINRSPSTIAKSAEYKKNRYKTLKKLVGELALLGPESNWNKSFVRGKNGEIKTVISRKVAIAIGNAFQNLGNKSELLLAKYFDLVRDELDLKVGEREEYKSATKSLQRNLEKKVLKLLEPVVKKNSRLYAYLGFGKPGKIALARLPKTQPITKAQKLAQAKKRASSAKAEARRVKATEKRVAAMDIDELIDDSVALNRPGKQTSPTVIAGRKTRRKHE